MVHLAHNREAPALETFDEPQLPQGPVTVERLGQNASHQAFEGAVASGSRQTGVTNVIREIEVVVVDPDRMVYERREAEFLPVAREPVKARFDIFRDAFGIESSALG